MFYATRVAAAVAIVALAAGAITYLAPSSSDIETTPAAVKATIEPDAFAGFSGTLTTMPIWDDGEAVPHEWGHLELGMYFPRATLEVSDDRLSGDFRAIANDIRVGDDCWGIRSATDEISNGGGTWTGHGLSYAGSRGACSPVGNAIFVGSGEYEGLTALISFTTQDSLFVSSVEGVVLPGDLPAAPVLDGVAEPSWSPAPMDPDDVAGFSGTMLCAPGDEGTTTETEWGSIVTGETYPRCLIETDDARIDGSSFSVHDYVKFAGRPEWGVRAHSDRISNDDGTWVGHGWGYQHPQTGTMRYTALYHGTGAYDGLTALMTSSQGAWGLSFNLDGVIFPGDPLGYPELPPIE